MSSLGGWGWGSGSSMAPSGAALSYIERVIALGPGAYWPFGEPSGATAGCEITGTQDGAYTGVDLAQTGMGDGGACPLFDKLNDYVDIYSVPLAAGFDVDAGTLMVWFKAFEAGVWTDGLMHQIIRLRADDNNYVELRKDTVNNTLVFAYAATGESVVEDTETKHAGSTDWIHLAMTWDTGADEMKSYSSGNLLNTVDTLGSWVGALDLDTCLAGARTKGPVSVLHGYLAHVAIWYGAALTQLQVASLASA